ncbi:MAG: hypothetical protein ACRD19_14290 [Terriglobia bacterium]
MEVEMSVNTQEGDLIDRILASSMFRKSPRLSGFLRFIYEQQIAGNENAINEQLIGTKVFGRRPGYHVGEDSIVRSQARFLRQRLAQYFATEGQHESLLISIPKGSYIPAFHPREHSRNSQFEADVMSEVLAGPDAEETQTPRTVAGKDTSHRPGWGWIAGTTLLLLLAVVLAFRAGRRTQAPSDKGRDSVLRAFWTSIFSPGRTVLFVPSDGSLVLLERLTNQRVNLVAYVNKDFPAVPANVAPVWDRIKSRRYTGTPDLALLAQFMRVPEAATARIEVRYGGDVSLAEMKVDNAILSGGPRSNPWEELFTGVQHFEVGHDETPQRSFIRDRGDTKNPGRLYTQGTSNGADEQAYGVLCFVPSLDGRGHVLLVESGDKTGTEAAGEFLQSTDFVSFLRKIGATDSHVPSFEVLISAHLTAGGVYNPKVVKWYKL